MTKHRYATGRATDQTCPRCGRRMLRVQTANGAAVLCPDPVCRAGLTAATTSQDDYETWTLDGNGRVV